MTDVIKAEDYRENIGDYDMPIYKAILVPKNATNGDMMKTMFPSIDFTEMAFTVHATTSVTSNGAKGGISYDFWNDWWNAPYNVESEDMNNG